MRKKNKLFGFLLKGVALLTLTIYSCQDKLDGETFYTTDAMNIVETLELNPELYSTYLEALEITGYKKALESYGSYTCFVPTNDAFEVYLAEEFGVSSVSELISEDQIAALQVLVKFHIVSRARNTSSFVEGRLVDTTYTGDYLTTSFLNGGGVANVMINREATLYQYDIDANNGIIHSLNGVLSPFVDPVPVVIDKTGNYTIFTEALKQTGFYEKFSELTNEITGNKKDYTLLIESDEVYNNEGIFSFEDLAARFSPDNSNYLELDNGLNRFIAYHAILNFLYSADFPDDSLESTILETYGIKFFKTDKELKINESETGENDTWTSLIGSQSNFPAKNGVYHTVNKLLVPFSPKAKYKLFDLVDAQPEYTKETIDSHEQVFSTAWSRVTWFPESTKRYLKQSKNPTKGYTVFDVGGFAYIEFETPLLPKGQYEVTVCSNTGNSARGVFQIYFDGEPIGGVYDVRTKVANLGWGEGEDMDLDLLEENGWRPGLKDIFDNTGRSAYETTNWVRFIVTKELFLSEQKEHVIRFETVKSGGMPIDYVEFIPVVD